MGKLRRQRKRKVPDLSPYLLQNDKFSTSGNRSTAVIVGQLQSADFNEKLNGLQALAVMAIDKEKADLICKSEIIRIVSPLLCERNDAIRDATAGALQNLSVCGPEFCEIMVDSDILIPLISLLNENLCEISEIALNVFNQSYIINGLLRCLDYNYYGLDIALSSAECLLVVSENNTESWGSFNQYSTLLHRLLTNTGSKSMIYLSTLSAGILCNVPALSAFYLLDILRTLNQILEINIQDELQKIQAILNIEKQAQIFELKIDNDSIDEETQEEGIQRRRMQEQPTQIEIIIKEMGYLIDSQRLSAEVISNLCCANEESWINIDNDLEGSENGIVGAHEMNEEKMNICENSLTSDAVQAIKLFNVKDKIWQKAQPLCGTVHSIIGQNIAIKDKLKKMRISCLLCLQNLCSALSVQDLGGEAALYNVWVNLGLQVFKGPQDATIIESMTSLMCASLELLKSNKSLFQQTSANDINLILSGIANCSDSEVRINWLRMIGTLGSLLPEALVKVIIIFLLETCKKESEVYIISEALDALMDIFVSNDWNAIIVETNMVETIKYIESQFRLKTRRQCHEIKDNNFPVVQTVKGNLRRFVKYIEDEFAKYNKCV